MPTGRRFSVSVDGRSLCESKTGSFQDQHLVERLPATFGKLASARKLGSRAYLSRARDFLAAIGKILAKLCPKAEREVSATAWRF